MEIKKITNVDKIQFKRCLDYKGTYSEAIAAVKKIDPALKSGEPMIVSFRELEDATTYSYFLAIGRNIRVGKKIVSSPVITPFFANITDNIEDIYNEFFNRYIKDCWNIADLEELRKEDPSVAPSDILRLAKDASGNLVIAIMNRGEEESVDVVTNRVNSDTSTYEDIEISKLDANNQGISYVLKDLYNHNTPGLEFDDEGNAIIQNMGTYMSVTQNMIENIYQLNVWVNI